MIKIGDTVLCRLYNTPERKFYGEMFTGVIKQIGVYFKGDDTKSFLVEKDNSYCMWLHRKEIKRIIK